MFKLIDSESLASSKNISTSLIRQQMHPVEEALRASKIKLTINISDSPGLLPPSLGITNGENNLQNLHTAFKWALVNSIPCDEEKGANPIVIFNI